ncbi:MAG: STAS domain-containing protein [Ilumatobacter sp.]|uniref:STAS domain-containing protein n=1 Tax=Ilumatobacter sp. TaxID=1967498 RepID=UPI003297CE89
MSAAGEPLRLSVSTSGDIGSPVAEIHVVGEFDRLQVVRFDETARTLPAALVSVTVDLTQTTIIDSAALGSLIRLRRTLERHGCSLQVVVERPFQITVMKVGGLDDHLNVRTPDQR